MPEPLHLLLITDRKPGHENQLLALSSRVAELTPVVAHELDVSRAGSISRRFVTPALPPTASRPDLILAAGRTTHRPALKLKKRHGARLVVCMRPTVPLGKVDLALVPEHDEPVASANVETTLGAIVRVFPSGSHDPSRGVFLVGGPSKHHGVDEDDLVRRIAATVERTPGVLWELTTSRRTPEGLTRRLVEMGSERLVVTPASETERGWVGERLARAGTAWITEDSVSMIFESLTSGCATGLLPMPRLKAGRVASGVDRLVERGIVTAHDAFLDGAQPEAPREAIDEAGRCARLISERFFPARLSGGGGS